MNGIANRYRSWLEPRAIATGLLAFSAIAAAADISPKEYQADVTYLASPQLKGRATGSAELEKAADFIAAKFKSFGLKPEKQAFPVIIGAHLGPKNSLGSFPASDFQPFSFSSSGSITAPVVFAGYGITDNDKHSDDYSGVDVTGKIVLLLRHEPHEGKELSSHSALAEKAVNAKMHGAKAVLLVNDIYNHNGEDKGLDKFGVAAGPTDAGVFFMQVKPAVADQLLGGKLRELTENPHSFALDGAPLALSVDIQRDSKTVHNVTAYLRGSTDEYVIVGAHYDHLGLGDEHSLAPSQIGTIHPGADDNASGTAGVIELARYFTKQPKPKRGILFLTFAGEELGLLGSGYYVNNPTMPLEKAVAMINMDMIGRIREGKVYIGGTGTGDTFDKLLSSVHAEAPLDIVPSEKTGYGSSDHTSFTTKSIPTLFFFSGLHGDYHKPSDTADKIDAADAAKLLDYVAQIVVHFENDPRPKFIRVAEPSMSTESSGGGSGYGPAFGSIPDFNEPPKGVRFADVRDGTPAAKAGLKAGDILIEFDGKDIANLYDFTYALRAHKPGDLVLVKVIRGTQTIEAKVLLTERK